MILIIKKKCEWQVVEVAALTDRAMRAMQDDDHLEVKQKVVSGTVTVKYLMKNFWGRKSGLRMLALAAKCEFDTSTSNQ